MTSVIPNPLEADTTAPLPSHITPNLALTCSRLIPPVQWLMGLTPLITHSDIINLTLKLTTRLGRLPPEILQTLTFTKCHDQFSAFLIMLKP